MIRWSPHTHSHTLSCVSLSRVRFGPAVHSSFYILMYLSLLDVGCVLVRVFDKSTVAKGVQRKLNTKKEDAKETKYQKRIIYIRVIERGGAREIEYIRYTRAGEL